MASWVFKVRSVIPVRASTMDRTWLVLLCLLFLIAATTEGWCKDGNRTVACVDGALVREQCAAVHDAFDGV